jgi:hypothetical protein
MPIYGGMDNRMGDVYAIDVTTEEGYATLTGWIDDYLTGEENGGLANFARRKLRAKHLARPGTPEEGSYIVTRLGRGREPAMTFAGYNDSIRVDYNNDGQYTNDIDITGDDVVDIRDWEIGALLVVNSWGTNWGNDGKIWMMARLLAEPPENGGIYNRTVHVMHARADYQPLFTCRAVVTHEQRDRLRLCVGLAADTTLTEPTWTLDYPIFCNQGGALYMQGDDDPEDKTLELGLDVTPLLGHITPGQPVRWFFEVHEDRPRRPGLGAAGSVCRVRLHGRRTGAIRLRPGYAGPDEQRRYPHVGGHNAQLPAGEHCHPESAHSRGWRLLQRHALRRIRPDALRVVAGVHIRRRGT